MKDLIFDGEYTGPRFTYRMKNRPAGLGCQPPGRICGADRDDGSYFGTIEYAHPLTAEEIASYELLDLNA